MKDIKETMELFDAILDLVNEIEKDSEDGKIKVMEILDDYPEILKLIQETKDHEEIIEELKDLSADEAKEISAKLIEIIAKVLKIIKNLKK